MTMLKRRRGFIFKVIIGLPILWFSFIGFAVVISGGGIPDQYNNNPKMDVHVVPRAGTTFRPSGLHPNIQNSHQVPVIEKPNPDRDRFFNKIKADAEQDLKAKQQGETPKKSFWDRGWFGNPKEDNINKGPKISSTETQGKETKPRDPNAPGESE